MFGSPQEVRRMPFASAAPVGPDAAWPGGTDGEQAASTVPMTSARLTR